VPREAGSWMKVAVMRSRAVKTGISGRREAVADAPAVPRGPACRNEATVFGTWARNLCSMHMLELRLDGA
jgi:hypothetical protein